MPRKLFEGIIDQQQGWLDPIGEAVGNAVIRAKIAGGDRATQVLDWLHGVWLGHPLHPAITDVPVGAWTAAFAMDAIDGVAPTSSLRRCADGAIALGVCAGVGAAASGIADWHHLGGHNRRLGLLHGLLNLGALALYTMALALRLGDRRSLGAKLSMLSYALTSFSAYLGGELVYGAGIGVDHTAWQKPPRDFVPVLPEAELEENKPRRVYADSAPILLVRRHGHIHALSETCTHLGGPLADGRLADEGITCPWHGSLFALDDGRVVHGPATFGETSYDVRIKDGQIEVRPSAWTQY
ncbi:MAG: Rieske (2Fe-2S) protein [Dehalococcoidales bacterium]|nr:Rieske (2Fe-2S) protein [Dehalococcoidales bacterium]